MSKLAKGNLNAISSFVLNLKHWDLPSPEMQALIMEMLGSEVRVEIAKACINWLDSHGDEALHNPLIELIQQTPPSQKRDLLVELLQDMEARLELKRTPAQEKKLGNLTKAKGVGSFSDTARQMVEKKQARVANTFVVLGLAALVSALTKKSTWIVLGILLILSLGAMWWILFRPAPELPPSAAALYEKSLQTAKNQKTGDKKQVLDLLATVQSVDPDSNILRVTNKEGVEFEVEFKTNWKLGEFKPGTAVRLIGSVNETTPGGTLLEGIGVFPRSK